MSTIFTSTEVLELLAESPRDATQSRVLFVPLDEGDTTWNPGVGQPDGTITRAKNGGTIIGVVYVQWPDGGISARPVQAPTQTKTSRKQG